MRETTEMSLVDRLREFMETEARSCSMDFGCVTPEYVSRMWGGQFSKEDIDMALKELRASCYEL